MKVDSTNFYDKFIYQDIRPHFTGYDATRWCLGVEEEIVFKWKATQLKKRVLNLATASLADFFLAKTTTFEELKTRISLFKNEAARMDQAARFIQRSFAQKKYASARAISEKAKAFTSPQISSSIIGLPYQFLRSCYQLSAIDFLHPKGQIIWQKINSLRKLLYKEGNFYVFLHAHSYPISLHLDLSTHFQSKHHSAAFRELKPEANRAKFRARGIARHFKNTQAYLKSALGRAINLNFTIDDMHRETIISCDGVSSNTEPYESARHFMNSNKSIVDTCSSTGKSHAVFDRQYIASYLKNSNLCDFAAIQFQKARARLRTLGGYGMVRVIAIPKSQIKNSQTNYVWRSHAFGVACRCKNHTPTKNGHAEFAATLEKHQNDSYHRCHNGSIPQYRILAENLDRDSKKQIYKIDCLNESERRRYEHALHILKNKLTPLVELERLHLSKNYEELLDILRKINIKSRLGGHYHKGVKRVLGQNRKLISKYAHMLKNDLEKAQWAYLEDALSYSRLSLSHWMDVSKDTFKKIKILLS